MPARMRPEVLIKNGRDSVLMFRQLNSRQFQHPFTEPKTIKYPADQPLEFDLSSDRT